MAKIENKEKLPILDVLDIRILPISQSLMYSGRIIIVTDTILATYIIVNNTRWPVKTFDSLI